MVLKIQLGTSVVSSCGNKGLYQEIPLCFLRERDTWVTEAGLPCVACPVLPRHDSGNVNSEPTSWSAHLVNSSLMRDVRILMERSPLGTCCSTLRPQSISGRCARVLEPQLNLNTDLRKPTGELVTSFTVVLNYLKVDLSLLLMGRWCSKKSYRLTDPSPLPNFRKVLKNSDSGEPGLGRATSGHSTCLGRAAISQKAGTDSTAMVANYILFEFSGPGPSLVS